MCIKLAFQLENAKLSSDQSDKAAGAAREELKEALMRIEALSYQLSGLQKQASTVEDRIRELEETMAGEREKIRKMLDAKEREMTDMRDQMQQQPTKYLLQLLDVTLALGAYGKLLKGEEGDSTSVTMALPERDLYPPQKICAAWQQTRSVGGGLYNLGNTCYLNSILQCLTYTPPLANYLLSRQHSQSCEEKGFCMMCTMEVHVEEVLSCSGSAVAPVAVVRELPRIGDFQFGAQEDAHEFFGCAVDAMQTACLSSSSECEQRVSASRRLTIHQASNVLTVRLKRVDPFSGRKITKFVRYPEYLEIGKYTSEASGGPLLYSLYAVVIHEGHSCQRGHYYCFVKASDRRWYKMDDASVVLCDIQTVLSRCAYLLFYVRRHDLTPRAGAERQETQSAGLAKSVQDAKNPFSGGFVAPRKPEGFHRGDDQNQLRSLDGAEHRPDARAGVELVGRIRVTSSPSTQDMEVTWYREQLVPFVHRYKGGRDQNGNQMLEYVGRTELWKDGLAKGSVNLTIFDVQLSDRGNYTCFVVSGSDYDEAVVELKVTGDRDAEIGHRDAEIAPLKVMGPPGPVIVAIGEDAVLPCRFSPAQSTQDMEVTWYREQLAYFVHRYKGGRDQRGNQMLEYVGRTELWKDGLAKGSVNLTIFNVQLSDRGNYTCFVVNGSDYDQAVVELKVTASGSVPLVTLERYQDGGIRVSCRSAGWYPQPQVLWRDPHGQHLPSLSESVTQDQSSLFAVESSIILTRGTKQNVSCWVRHVLDGQEQGSEFYISDPFFHNDHPLIIALGIVSVAVVVLLIFAVYLFKIKAMRDAALRDRDAEIEKQAEELGEYHSPSYMGDFSSGTFLHLGFAPFP
ncbi:hypothetical protein Q9233_000508 [Columba guinea]|nr:hypothetical protein Q9233_000508 [Columba guinea]